MSNIVSLVLHLYLSIAPPCLVYHFMKTLVCFQCLSSQYIFLVRDWNLNSISQLPMWLKMSRLSKDLVKISWRMFTSTALDYLVQLQHSPKDARVRFLCSGSHIMLNSTHYKLDLEWKFVEWLSSELHAWAVNVGKGCWLQLLCWLGAMVLQLLTKEVGLKRWEEDDWTLNAGLVHSSR